VRLDDEDQRSGFVPDLCNRQFGFDELWNLELKMQFG